MANLVAIVGMSGSGKSTSIETLDPKETVIISVLGKPLPFKGWKKKYTKMVGATGNYVVTDNSKAIVKTVQYISEKRKEVKTIIIDDYQYVLANEYMKKAFEKGYEKYTSIGKNAWDILDVSARQRDGLTIFILAHAEETPVGQKIKTVGKMLDEKITLEGLFTVVIFSVARKTEENEVEYIFQTQTDGNTTAKSPKGMFETVEIPNDLSLVIQALKQYEK